MKNSPLNAFEEVPFILTVTTLPTSVEIDNHVYNVTGIGYAAFSGAKLDLSIPSNISDIEQHAFYGCTGRVYIPNTVTNIGSAAFRGYYGDNNNRLTLYIQYKSSSYIPSTWANGWTTADNRTTLKYDQGGLPA